MPGYMRTKDYSALIGTAAGPVPITFGSGGASDPYTRFLRLVNASPPGGPTIWLSRAGVASVNGAGSFPLVPGQAETWTDPQPIPVNPLSAVATAAGAALTVEVG